MEVVERKEAPGAAGLWLVTGSKILLLAAAAVLLTMAVGLRIYNPFHLQEHLSFRSKYGYNLTKDVGPSCNSSAAHISAALTPGPQLPKVALMFLTRGEMPQEATWGAFLEGVVALGPSGEKRLAPSLFNVYIHPPPGYKYENGSLFFGREVEGRVKVSWGSSSEVTALRALIRAALADPLNQQFVMLSESCTPIYPAATVYLAIMSLDRSRQTACNEWWYPTWKPVERGMLDWGIQKKDWRKAWQWTILIRKHANLVAYDDVVMGAFHEHCQRELHCLAAEHYVPTLLAHHQLEKEVDCKAQTTFAIWPPENKYSAHPMSWGPSTANPATLKMFRGDACEQEWSSMDMKAAKGTIWAAMQQAQQAQQAPNGQPCNKDVLEEALGHPVPDVFLGSCTGGCDECQVAAHAGRQLLLQVVASLNTTHHLPSKCTLFARKITKDAAGPFNKLLVPTLRA